MSKPRIPDDSVALLLAKPDQHPPLINNLANDLKESREETAKYRAKTIKYLRAFKDINKINLRTTIMSIIREALKDGT
jgi:hypothetical protein